MENNFNVYTADIGGNTFNYYDSLRDEFYGKEKHEVFLNLSLNHLKKGDIIVIEDAHMREKVKGGKSMAHPFFFHELEKIYLNAQSKEVIILLFPQCKSAAVRRMAGFDAAKRNSNKEFQAEYGMTTDEADCRALAQFLKRDPEAFRTLKKFKPIREDYHKRQSAHVNTFIEKLNDHLNVARGLKYGKYHSDKVSLWIKKYLIEPSNPSSNLIAQGLFPDDVSLLDEKYLGTDPAVLEALGISFNKRSGKLNKPQDPYKLYTFVCTIMDPETGEPRTREFPPIDPKTGKTHKYYSEDKGGNYTGEKKPANWHFIKEHVYNFNPYHTKGGVAGSNIKKHFRPKLSKLLTGYEGFLGSDMSDDEYATFKKGRTAADKKIQKIFSSLRQMIVKDGHT